LQKEGKSSVLAVILSLVIPGLGHFYLGSSGKGVMFLILQALGVGLVCSVVLAIVGIPLLLINPIWAAVDAHMASHAA
jgi:TM2 domain-containing membrane protein YozV